MECNFQVFSNVKNKLRCETLENNIHQFRAKRFRRVWKPDFEFQFTILRSFACVRA